MEENLPALRDQCDSAWKNGLSARAALFRHVHLERIHFGGRTAAPSNSAFTFDQSFATLSPLRLSHLNRTE